MKKILLIIINLSLLGQADFIRSDEMVIDTKTDLIWQDNTDAKTLDKSWSDAKQYCQDLTLKGRDDWRLPSMKELLTITDKNRYKPAIASEFKSIGSYYYWSSSLFESGDKSAFFVSFFNGGSNTMVKTSKNSVRCVRAGQSSLTFDKSVKALLKTKFSFAALHDPGLSLKKDMFETETEFKKRVHAPAFVKRIQQIKNEAIKEALEVTYGKPILSNLKYDAENAYFVADLSFEVKQDFKKQRVAIEIPKNIARDFFKAKESLQAEAIFEYDEKGIRLKRIEVPFQTNNYLAQFTDKDIDNTRVAMNLFSVKGLSLGTSEVKSFDTTKLKSFKDLDKLLSKASKAKADKTKWLFVIGIEQYEFTDNISFAKRSAEMFIKTAQKTLGIPKENSYIMINSQASQAHIKTSMKKMLRRVKAGDSIYFYYNGHGIPVPSKKNEPYLLAFNSEPDYIQDESFFSLQSIYSTLSDSKAGKIVAVVDSCFSGVTDGKAVLKGVAATRVVAKRTSFNKDKMVVMSAGKGHQYSNAYNKKGHRLFSFYLMKNMLEGDKNIKTLYKDTKAQTYQTSLEEYGDSRTQEPTIQGNTELEL